MSGVAAAAAQESLDMIRARLRAHFPRRSGQDLWLMTPHPQLGYERPENVISEGRGNDVLAIIDLLDDEAG